MFIHSLPTMIFCMFIICHCRYFGYNFPLTCPPPIHICTPSNQWSNWSSAWNVKCINLIRYAFEFCEFRPDWRSMSDRATLSEYENMPEHFCPLVAYCCVTWEAKLTAPHFLKTYKPIANLHILEKITTFHIQTMENKQIIYGCICVIGLCI